MMNYVYYDTSLQETMILTEAFHTGRVICENDNLYKFIWVWEGKLTLTVDHVEIEMGQDEIISMNNLHRAEFKEVSGKYLALLFNENFYGICKHEKEVSCSGVLFGGTSCIVHLHLPIADSGLLHEVVDRMIAEYILCDNLQGEMLRLLLKRFVILCTRLARKQLSGFPVNEKGFDIIQRYYVLVDNYFKEKKQVQAYAALLHRSPKTLSNLFAAYGMPSPLKVIQERVVTEAKRLLLHTSHSVKEISVILGFESVGTFSRFFKNMTGENTSAYRKRLQ
ncbi:helix-turn-helix domain-containing protein [Phocaeicola sp.]|uniref:helix-turn-helix domain-containing protein n=1 Tax=Phocaeicola sp. TaxID=2773926 RepID=UPI0023D1EDBE|nr:helix-turn-helix domain-containing protein [Phocaeicola sp.]MDE5677541.1 helix-turn-helix domain-containing protein [Phocaeicola sp.]